MADYFDRMDASFYSPIARWGTSVPVENVRRILYKPPLTKFLLDNGGDPAKIHEFLWLNKTTAFKLEAGTPVVVPQK